MAKYLLFITLLYILPILPSYAQAVEINVGSKGKEPSAILDVSSNSLGLLVPSLTETQKNALGTRANPALDGLLIYQTDGTPGFYIYTGFPPSWKELSRNGKPEIFSIPLGLLDSVGVANQAIEKIHIAAGGTITTQNLKDGAIGETKLKNGSIESDHFIPSTIPYDKVNTTGLSDGLVYRWDAALSKWTPSYLLEGIQFKGNYDITTNTPALADTDHTKGIKNGAYYVSTTSGIRDFGNGSQTVNSGNWVIYNNNQWTPLKVNSIASVFGRVGNISAQKKDYKWSDINTNLATLKDISDISINTSIKTGHILRWNNSSKKWEQDLEYGDPRKPIPSDGINSNAVTGDKFAPNSITEAKIPNVTITDDKIATNSIETDNIDEGVVGASHLSGTGIQDSAVLVAQGGLWKPKNIGKGLRFIALWNANTNYPLISPTPTIPYQAGDFYIVSKDGVQNLGTTSINFQTGDYVIYNKPTGGTGVWERIPPQNAINSFNGRPAGAGASGAITAQAGDYTWGDIEKSASTITDIEDIDVSSVINTRAHNNILMIESTPKGNIFKLKPSLGHKNNPLKAGGIKTKALKAIHIKSGTIDERNIGNDNIIERHFSTKSVKSNHISMLTISEAKLSNNLISSDHFSTSSKIQKDHIQDKTIISKNILDLSISKDNLDDASIEAQHIAADAITSSAITANSINSNIIRNSSIATAHGSSFANNAVTKDILVDNTLEGKDFETDAVESSHILNGSVSHEDIATGAAKARNIKASAIKKKHLNPNIITNSKIANGTIKGVDINGNSITKDLINNLAVKGKHIQDDQITTVKISDGSVESDNLKESIILSSTKNRPNPKAILELEHTPGTPKGFLLPRLTSNDILGLMSSVTLEAGLTVYNTNKKSVYTWNGTSWSSLSTISGALVTEAEYEQAFIGDKIIFDGREYRVIYAGGRLWLDRNLGALQVATTNDDFKSQGWLYQWGRKTDGHQFTISLKSATQIHPISSSTANYISAVSLTGTSVPRSHTWMNPNNNDLWQGPTYQNNPCPKGWMVPTPAAWLALGFTKNDDPFKSDLKLPFGKSRSYHTTVTTDDYTIYWTSNPTTGRDEYAEGYRLRTSATDNTSKPTLENHGRSIGAYVRCVKI